MAIGEAIRKTRESKGYSRERLAKKSGVTQITLYQWETDKFSPTVTLLIDVADALGVTLDELVGRRAPNGKAQP